MGFFEKFFEGNINELNNGELAVCCPFPHTSVGGGEYYETNPSAHINPDKRVFHCKVCGESHSEVTFIAKTQNVSYSDAVRLSKEITKDVPMWKRFIENLKNSEDSMNLVKSLGIESVIDELEIGYQGKGISFPVKIFGTIADIRTYDPKGKPKVTGTKGSTNLVIPFDLWLKDDRPTLLCAGEKDMAIARAKGFNAITFTGGEMSFPKILGNYFKGKKVYIAYDNDDAGVRGAESTAVKLKDIGAYPYIVDLSRVCTENGEDIHDFFMKYGRSPEDLQVIIGYSEPFSEERYSKVKDKEFPLVTIKEAYTTKYVNQTISSRVAVISKSDKPLQVPEIVEITKEFVGSNCVYKEGHEWEYYLDDGNIQDIMMMCDSGLKFDNVVMNIRKFLGIPKTEAGLKIKVLSSKDIYKLTIVDDTESEISKGDEVTMPTEMNVYSLFPLDTGKKYRVYYKRFPHPLQSQEIVGIITKVEESDTSVNKFKVNQDVLESLKCFQADDGKVSEKMDEIAERVKAFAGVETNKNIAWFTDLFYHTPLDFMFGDRKERATLDMMLIGEPRSGKSQTSYKLMEMYELGVITSLKTATSVGLIGGSDQTSGGFKTRIGLLPRNHEGAVIIEEFSGGGQQIIEKLTEIRSSNMVRITRVNGTITVPCKVRMLSISNPATLRGGQSLPLRQYPNGVKVVLDLVGASEDIARYDLFMLVDTPDSYISPTEKVELEAFPKESYMNRVRWIWSRKPEQVRISEQVQEYIVWSANKLNRMFDTHLKFFGAEAWKKLSRLAIGVASCVCSMDETGEKLIVKNEHVEWAMKFMVSCYDNSLFRLKSYVNEIRRYTEVDAQAINALQGLYRNNKVFITQLAESSDLSMQHLRSLSGLDNKEFNRLINRLSECYFVQIGERITPSERFRKAFERVSDAEYLKKVGEL